MQSWITFVRSHALALVAIFIAVGGTAYAANTVGSEDVIDNSLRSIDLRNNDIRGADVRLDTLTGADVDESTLAEVPSAESADSADNVLSAKVLNNGTLAGGDGAVDAARGGVGTGNYTVGFDRSVVNICAITVTLSDSTSGEAVVDVPIEIFDDTTIDVRTRTSAGASADRAFDVIAVC